MSASNTPANPKPSHVVKSSTKEAIIGVVCGVLVLAFVVYGVLTMSSRQDKASGNTLSGKVVEKQFIPAPEQRVTFGGKGVRSEKVDGEYILKVRVKGEDRVFDVPVDKNTYEAARIGSSQSFLRPPSEQRQ